MQAVVFDLDGVLIDSGPLWDEVRRQMAQDAGVSWPKDATRVMQGVGTADWSRYMAEVVGLPDPPAVIAERVITAMSARYKESLPLIPAPSKPSSECRRAGCWAWRQARRDR